MSFDLANQFQQQRLANEYAFVDGEAMHAEHGSQFQIPPPVLKRHIRPGQFVELRIDSPRFSMHEEDAEQCSCPSCNGAFTKPILRHDAPLTLVPIPRQDVPSRGWGEDFWVRVEERVDDYFRGTVDNHLAEVRLHGVDKDQEVIFHENHILAIHDVHREELVVGMDATDLKELAVWLGSLREQD